MAGQIHLGSAAGIAASYAIERHPSHRAFSGGLPDSGHGAGGGPARLSRHDNDRRTDCGPGWSPGGGRMKAVTTLCPDTTPLTRARLADFVELTKPRVMVLVLFTVAVGALMAASGLPDSAVLVHTLFGTALVAAGASA